MRNTRELCIFVRMKNNKLTLSVEKELVNQVKKYISQDNETITGIVSDFLETYVAMKSQNTPLAQDKANHASKYAGIITLHAHLSKEDIADTIISKHSKRFK